MLAKLLRDLSSAPDQSFSELASTPEYGANLFPPDESIKSSRDHHKKLLRGVYQMIFDLFNVNVPLLKIIFFQYGLN